MDEEESDDQLIDPDPRDEDAEQDYMDQEQSNIEQAIADAKLAESE